MRLLLKLIFREAWYHRARMGLALLAIVATSCLIVWLIGHFNLLIRQFDQDAGHYLGHYDLALVPDGGGSSGPGGRRSSGTPSFSVAPRNPRSTVGENRNSPSERTSDSRSGGPGRGGPRSPFPSDIVERLRDDPAIDRFAAAQIVRGATVARRSNDRSALDKIRSNLGIPQRNPMILGIDTTLSPFEMEDGRWFSETAAIEGDDPVIEGVLGTGAANDIGGIRGGKDKGPVLLGDELLVMLNGAEFRIKIVGLIEQELKPGAGGGGRGGMSSVSPVVSTLYISLADAAKIAQSSVRPDLFFIQLKKGENLKEFEASRLEKFSLNRGASGPPDGEPVAAEASRGGGEGQIPKLKWVDIDDVRATLNRGRSPDEIFAQSYSAIVLSVVASVFIIFTTLSMGVSERVRALAILRMVAFDKRQIAALILGESLLLGLIGWFGGLFAGWAILQLSALADGNLAHKTVSLGWLSVVVAGVCALIGSLLAALIPAWRAMRIRPLEAMSRDFGRRISHKPLYLAGLIGLGLLAINPMIVYTGDFSPFVRMSLYGSVGLGSMTLGFVLLTPTAILLTEKFLSSGIAALLRIKPQLLANQLSSNLWRTLGTTVSLSVGLGLYSMFEIWGYSMLVPFVPSPNLPNTLAAFMPTGIPESEIETVRRVPGVDPDRFMPLAIEQPVFSENQLSGENFSRLPGSWANAVLFGLDPDLAFSGTANGGRPMIRVPFEAGSAKTTLEKLKEPNSRYCVIPDTFAVQTGLKVGDKLELVPPNAPDRVIEYEICGIAEIDGWHWITKTSGVRLRSGRTAAMVLAAYDSVKKDFGLKDSAYFWFDRQPGASFETIERDMQQIAERSANPTLRKRGLGELTVTKPMVKVSTTESMTEFISSHADSVIQAMSKMPMIILAIASLGMMGTIAASVRTRRFELGVLRSVGLSRSGLVRLILAEAILIAFAAILLSLGFGLLGAWCSIGTARYVSVFGGIVPPLVLPIRWLALGFGTALGLCLIAALYPAVATGREEPAALLREK